MKVFSALALILTIAFSGPAAARQFAAPSEPIVIGRSFVLPSKIMGAPRRINVMLPPNYEREPARRYPVLFLLDGGVEQQDFLHIAGMVHQASLWGVVEPMILVGVESVDRRAELTAPSTNPGEQKDFPTHGHGERFRRFLVDELKPAVAMAYRGNGTTALMGESLAGLFVVDTALRHSGDFDRYVAVSPSLWWSDGDLSRKAPELLAEGKGSPTLWLTIADEGGEMQAGVDRLVAALGAQSRVSWSFRPMPDEHHNTINHPAATRALRDLFPAPKR